MQCDSSEVGTVMIKSDVQRGRTLAQIEGFRQALARAVDEQRCSALQGQAMALCRCSPLIGSR